MRKGSALGINLVVAVVIALIVLVISVLLVGGSLRDADVATSQCEQNLGVCLEFDDGRCPQGQNLRYSCPGANEMCCSTARLPVNTREVIR